MLSFTVEQREIVENVEWNDSKERETGKHCLS